jgi:hypothetical protein
MAVSTIKETQESTAAAGEKLNHALVATQEAGSSGASTARMLAAAANFRDTMNDGHLKADAIEEVLQIASKRLSDNSNDFLPPSKSRYSACLSQRESMPALMLLLCCPHSCFNLSSFLFAIGLLQTLSGCLMQKDCANLFARQRRHSSSAACEPISC